MTASPDNDYTYDDLDRLTQVVYHDDQDEQFTYDKLGNRENVKMRDGGDVDYYVNDLVNQYAGIGAPPGHWKLNDKPGAYAIDATNDYDGTIHSANWTDSGKFEDALILDGVNDYVFMDGGDGGDSFAGVAGANPRTIAAWIDPNDAGVIASWGTDDAGGDKPVWNFVVATGGDFDFILGVVVNDSGAITGLGTGFDAGGGWQHAAVTFDGSELLFYLNGEPSDSQTLSGVNTNADPYVYARIGVGSDDMGDYFEGKIDNVMIFDRALSTEEIVSLADAGNDNVLSVAATVYDKAGNLTTDYRGYKYSYDYENRLLEIADSDDTSIVAYAYDALGRRIQKDDKIAGAKTRYYHNHDWQVLAEYDDDGYHLRSYIYGNYIDEVLVMVDPNAAEDYYYAHNHLYSPTALLDETGAIIERYDYDAYGRPYFLEPNMVLSATQSSDYNNSYLFTGRRVDILDNGNLTLQYSRNRYYDYHTGRWLTKDPIGYRDGMNLYGYVRSNPVIYTDSRGLLCEVGCGLGGIVFEECMEACNALPWETFKRICKNMCRRILPNDPGIDENVPESEYNCAGLAFRVFRNVSYEETLRILGPHSEVECSERCLPYSEKCWLWEVEMQYNAQIVYPPAEARDTPPISFPVSTFHIVCGECDQHGEDPKCCSKPNVTGEIVRDEQTKEIVYRPCGEWAPVEGEEGSRIENMLDRKTGEPILGQNGEAILVRYEGTTEEVSEPACYCSDVYK
ncbi:RHS repeat domain-containing protein [Planctomycetota bacterium]